jgi:hypothetical protein
MATGNYIVNTSNSGYGYLDNNHQYVTTGADWGIGARSSILNAGCATHVVQDWVDCNEDTVTGVCTSCGESVFARKVPGGLPVLRLHILVQRMLTEPKPQDLLDLADLEELIAAEQQILDAARSLLGIARKSAQKAT